MKLVSIEKKETTEKVLVNPDQICNLFMSGGTVVLSTADGRQLETKFVDVHHAVDFINRAVFVAETD